MPRRAKRCSSRLFELKAFTCIFLLCPTSQFTLAFSISTRSASFRCARWTRRNCVGSRSTSLRARTSSSSTSSPQRPPRIPNSCAPFSALTLWFSNSRDLNTSTPCLIRGERSASPPSRRVRISSSSTSARSNALASGRPRTRRTGRPANVHDLRPSPVCRVVRHEFTALISCNPEQRILVIRLAKDCWFCLGSEKVERHLVVFVGDHVRAVGFSRLFNTVCVSFPMCFKFYPQVYLALPKGGIHPLHALITPIGHFRSICDCPPEVLDEIQKYLVVFEYSCLMKLNACSWINYFRHSLNISL